MFRRYLLFLKLHKHFTNCASTVWICNHCSHNTVHLSSQVEYNIVVVHMVKAVDLSFLERCVVLDQRIHY